MRLLINGSPADFSLESEKNAGEILAALEKWGDSEHCILTSIEVDGKKFHTPEDPALETLPSEGIGEIKIDLIPRDEQVYEVIGEILAYARRARESLGQNGQAADLTELLSGVVWMREALLSSAKLLRLAGEEKKLVARLKDFEIALFKAKAAREEKKSVAPNEEPLRAQAELLLSDLRSLFNRAYFLAVRGQLARREKPESWRALETESARLIELVTGLFREAALAIQKGRDAVAMPLLQDGTEGLEITLAMVSAAARSSGIDPLTLLDGKNRGFQEICDHLKDKLSEIETSFKNADFVFLSDLLEYELAEIFPDLQAFFKDLAGKIKIS